MSQDIYIKLFVLTFIQIPFVAIAQRSEGHLLRENEAEKVLESLMYVTGIAQSVYGLGGMGSIRDKGKILLFSITSRPALGPK
jgi:hypothetical protein